MKVNCSLVQVCILLLAGCCNDPAPPQVGVQLDSSFFKIRLGSEWRYLKAESNTYDTITMKVVRVNADSGYVCNLFLSNSLIDSGVYAINLNGCSYHGLKPSGYSYFSDFELRFPAEVGSKWSNTFYGQGLNDSTEVISYNKDQKVLGVSYDMFYLRRTAYVPLSYQITQTLELAANIGVVRQAINVKVNLSPPQTQNYQLISFQY